MSLKKAEEYLENRGFLDHVIELEESFGILSASNIAETVFL